MSLWGQAKWNLSNAAVKYDANEHIYEKETDSQTSRMDLWLPRGWGWVGGGCHRQTAKYWACKEPKHATCYISDVLKNVYQIIVLVKVILNTLFFSTHFLFWQIFLNIGPTSFFLLFSFHIWYYTCFNAIIPNHPSLSHRVQKTVLDICVSFAVSYTGLSLPSF